MRTTKNITKRVAIATALLLSAAIVIGVPATTFARDYDYEYASQIIQPEDWEGGLTVGEGESVRIADVEVDTNWGYIDQVNEGVRISDKNSGTVNTNEGLVSQNIGEVSNNHGDVGRNNGTVTVNYEDGLVGGVSSGRTGGNDGRVVDNFGAVFNNEYGIVEINHGGAVDGGTINMNLGEGTLTGNVNVIKQMWEIVSNVWDKLTSKEGAAGDTYKELDENDALKNFWLWENGSVTLSASDNTKKISGITATGGDATITDNGNGTWTISGIGGDIAIDVVFDEKGNPIPVRVRKVTENEEDTGSGNNTTDTAPVTGNVLTAVQIQAMIESALAESLAQANGAAVTVIDLYLGNDPSLTADAVVALCGGNVAKRCHFTHNGQKFILFVPVMDTTSTAYQQCLVLLDAEPGKQAGPIRLSQIFAGVGVSLSQE